MHTIITIPSGNTEGSIFHTFPDRRKAWEYVVMSIHSGMARIQESNRATVDYEKVADTLFRYGEMAVGLDRDDTSWRTCNTWVVFRYCDTKDPAERKCFLCDKFLSCERQEKNNRQGCDEYVRCREADIKLPEG